MKESKYCLYYDTAKAKRRPKNFPKSEWKMWSVYAMFEKVFGPATKKECQNYIRENETEKNRKE